MVVDASCTPEDPCWPAFGGASGQASIASLKGASGGTLEPGSHDAIVLLNGLLPRNSGGLGNKALSPGRWMPRAELRLMLLAVYPRSFLYGFVHDGKLHSLAPPTASSESRPWFDVKHEVKQEHLMPDASSLMPPAPTKADEWLVLWKRRGLRLLTTQNAAGQTVASLLVGHLGIMDSCAEEPSWPCADPGACASIPLAAYMKMRCAYACVRAFAPQTRMPAHALSSWT